MPWWTPKTVNISHSISPYWTHPQFTCRVYKKLKCNYLWRARISVYNYYVLAVCVTAHTSAYTFYEIYSFLLTFYLHSGKCQTTSSFPFWLLDWEGEGSTCHALVDMLLNWHIGAENCQTSRVLLLDYSKVFGLVDHNIIIAKRATYGVTDILLRWVGSFLGDRCQRTRIGHEISDWLHLNGSVHQGSGLGPFPICGND